MVHILHQGFQFYILYNLASLRVRKIRFASLYRNPQIKTFEFRNFRIFSESFRNSKWLAWFPGQITIDRIIIISHDFLMTFSDLLKIWPFFSYLSPQVLLHSDWSKRASHKITRQTSFIRDVSNSALTNSKTRYVSRFSHFSRFFFDSKNFRAWPRDVDGSRDGLETIDYINNIEHNECFITSHKIQIKITWLKLP